MQTENKMIYKIFDKMATHSRVPKVRDTSHKYKLFYTNRPRQASRSVLRRA